MPTARQARRRPSGSVLKVAVASLIGTTIEWYDFFLYSTAAALIFDELFFPNFDPAAGTLVSLATIGVGFVARPVGAVLFGHLGDRLGRKSTLVLTIMITGFATFAIGLLPTYSAIGIMAPVLLVVARLVQGLGVAGEWAGAVLIAVEHAPPHRRGFYGSFPQMGAAAGLLLSSGVFAVVSSMPDEQFTTWGWRVPFLLSVFLVVVGVVIRRRVSESPLFVRLQETGDQPSRPVVEVLRTNFRQVLLAMGARVADNGIYYVLATFGLTYATALDFPRATAVNALLLAAAVWLVTIPAYGALSDRLGRKPVYLFGAVGLGLYAFPFFWLLQTRSTPLLFVAMVVGLALLHGAMYGPQSALFSELFDTRTRYSGASLGYNLTTVFVGGPAPLVAATLLVAAGGDPWLVAVYMIIMAALTVVSVALMPESRPTTLSASGDRPGGDDDVRDRIVVNRTQP